jgi:photosystem II stability/assembly factor-like uncharacterized protein
MRRSLLKLLAGWACLPPLRARAEPAAEHFDALTTRALTTAKAAGSAMLAVARTGKRLVAAGERGIVLLSDDGGNSWHQAQVPVSTTLTALQFVDPRNGWAVGHLGVVLQTTDAGATWTLQLDGQRAAALAVNGAQNGGTASAGAQQAAALG